MNIFTYKNLLLIFLLFLNLLLLLKMNFFIPLLSGQNQMLDFDTYYRLVSDLKLGINPYSVDYMQTQGPPTVLFYFYPFTFVNLEIARTITTLIGLASGIAVSFLLARKLSSYYFFYYFLILNLLFFSAFPTRFALEMGQPNLLLTLIITVLLLKNGNKTTAVLTAILISIKTFLIFIPFSFLKSDRSQFYKCIIYTAVISLLSFVIISPFIYSFYLSDRLQHIMLSSNFITGLDYYNQSYGSTLARLGIFLSSKSYYSILIPGALYVIYRLKSVELAIISGLLLSFVSWQHYYTILFPIFILAYKKSGKIGLRTLLLSTLFFFWWIEFPYLHSAAHNFYNGILASHYFLSAMGLGVYVFFLSRYEMYKS